MLSPGILLTAAATLLAFIFSGRPAKLVRWALLISGLLQFISFFMLPGVAASGVPALFLGIGALVGAAAGFRTPLQWKGKWVLYQQRRWIAVSYLLAMLIYQLAAAALNVYFPALLWLFGAAVGLQLGFGMALFSKRLFLKKQPAAATSLLLLGVLTAGTLLPVVQVYGFSAIHNFDIAEWHVRCEITSSYFFNGEMTQEAMNNFPTADEILSAGGIAITPGAEATAVVDIPKGKCLYHLEAKVVGNALAKGSQDRYDSISGPIQITYMNQGVQGVMEGSSNCAGNLLMTRPSGDAPGDTGDEVTMNDTGADSGEAPAEPDSDGLNDGSFGDNPFVPVPLFDEDKQGAQESGLMTGMAGLISILTGLLPKGIVLDGGNRRTVPAKPAAPKSPVKVPQPSGEKAMSRANVGMRRADGQIYTRNHGWQNEDFPNLQVNSLRESVEKLKEQVREQEQKGDALRAGIAEDMLKEKQRELKRWHEDSATVSKVKSQQNEALYQGQSGRWKAHDESLEKAAGYAEAISFAADIGLAVASSGASTVYASAKSFSALKSAVKTIKVLTEAKEFVGMAASVADAVSNDKKSLVGAVVEEAINAKVGKIAGDLYGNAFKSMGFTKVGSSVDDLTKALVSSGNTYTSSVAQDAAKGVGLTGYIPDKINEAEKNFTAVVNRIANAQQGGR